MIFSKMNIIPYFEKCYLGYSSAPSNIKSGSMYIIGVGKCVMLFSENIYENL